MLNKGMILYVVGVFCSVWNSGLFWVSVALIVKFPMSVLWNVCSSSFVIFVKYMGYSLLSIILSDGYPLSR